MVTDFAHGVGLLERGLLICARMPRLLVLGLIPVAVTGVLFLAGFVTLLLFLGDLAAAERDPGAGRDRPARGGVPDRRWTGRLRERQVPGLQVGA
ncbi:MAG: hypothetical protein GEV12_20565 [Micromonosporaceae bacterium]|nr:hypothetical protein [Micromonosporaceae bacterium]